jgi:hypothetical protein
MYKRIVLETRDEKLDTSTLYKNDFVKVSNFKERFFVKIEKVDKNYIFGKIANNLVDSKHNIGDKIRFSKQKVLSIYNDN